MQIFSLKNKFTDILLYTNKYIMNTINQNRELPFRNKKESKGDTHELQCKLSAYTQTRTNLAPFVPFIINGTCSLWRLSRSSLSHEALPQ